MLSLSIKCPLWLQRRKQGFSSLLPAGWTPTLEKLGLQTGGDRHLGEGGGGRPESLSSSSASGLGLESSRQSKGPDTAANGILFSTSFIYKHKITNQ